MAAMITVLQCKECDWFVNQEHSTNLDLEFNRDALAGHTARVHGKRDEAYGLDRGADVCPFKDEPLRAAFIAGWLARGERP
jgi:hypothetical protein